MIYILYPPTSMRLLLDARIAALMKPIPLSLSIKMLPTRRTSLSAPAAAVQAARGLLGPLLLYKWTLLLLLLLL